MIDKKDVIKPLQSIRAIACFMIFLYHGIGSRFNYGGAWGVSVFFVLSGFILVYSYWDRPVEPTIRNAFTFSASKIKKLFVLHVIMLFVGLIREIPSHQTNVITSIIKLGLTIPLLQTWFPKVYQALNSVDWYLSVAAFLYVVFPYIMHHIKKQMPNKKKVYLLALCIYALQISVGAIFYYCFPSVDIKWIVYCFPLYRLGDFVIGCLFGYIYISTPSWTLWQKKASMAEVIILLLNVVSWIAFYYFESIKWFTYTCLFLPFTIGLIFIFAKGSGFVSKYITNKVILSFASISSCFFLIHRQILFYVEYGSTYLFHIKLSTPLNLLFAFVLTLILIKLYKRIEYLTHRVRTQL